MLTYNKRSSKAFPDRVRSFFWGGEGVGGVLDREKINHKKITCNCPEKTVHIRSNTVRGYVDYP